MVFGAGYPWAYSQYLNILRCHILGFGVFYSDGKLLACQLIGILFVLGWVSILMTPFFAILYYKGLLRADSLEEVVGLDVSYHGVNHLLGMLTQRLVLQVMKRTKGYITNVGKNNVRISATNLDDVY